MIESPQRSGSFRSLLVVAAVVMVAALAVAGARSYGELQKVRARETMLVDSLEKSRERSESLRQGMELVRTDAATLERLAREELGLVLPEDVIVLVPPGPPVE